MTQKVFVLTRSHGAFDAWVHFGGVFGHLEAAQHRAEQESRRKNAPLTQWHYDPDRGQGAWVMETKYYNRKEWMLFWMITEEDIEGLEQS